MRFVVSLLIIIPTSSYSASFECINASTNVEKIICSNSELSELDDVMSQLYKSAIAQNIDIKKSQREWIKDRNLCEFDGCLINSYKDRIDVLKFTIKDSSSKTTQLDEYSNQVEQPTAEAVVDSEALSASELPQKTEVPSASELPKKTIVNNPSTATMKTAKVESSNFNSEFVILVAILIGGAALFRVAMIYARREKIRKTLNQLYFSSSNVGDFQRDDQYIQAHLKSTENNRNSANIAIFKIILPVAKCTTVIKKAKWTAQIGSLDQSSYANAMNAYHIANNQYENEMRRFEAKESAKRQNNTDYNKAHLNGVPPKRPSKDDFVNYSQRSGITYANVNHGWKIPIKPELLTNINNQTLVSPFSEENKKIILNIYKDIAETKLKDNIPNQHYPNQLSIDKSYFFEIERNCIYSALILNANLGEYYKNLSIYDLEWEIEISANKNLPIVVVSSYSEHNKIKSTVHDCLAPDIIIDFSTGNLFKNASIIWDELHGWQRGVLGVFIVLAATYGFLIMLS